MGTKLAQYITISHTFIDCYDIIDNYDELDEIRVELQERWRNTFWTRGVAAVQAVEMMIPHMSTVTR